jgi:energy-converting hydrogenase B subunit D
VTALHAVLLTVVAVAGTAVVLTRDPVRQAVVSGMFGLALTALFFAFGAPDVALSMLVVSAVALPIMVLLTLARMRATEQEQAEEDG